MKAGDLVRYRGEHGDGITGVVASIERDTAGYVPYARIVWSLKAGPRYDDVPLEDLEVISESR